MRNVFRTGRRVWDPIVRLTHWSVAVAVLLNSSLVPDGSGLHLWLGYIAMAALGLRAVWGCVGTERARFSSFRPDLKAAGSHIKTLVLGRTEPHQSHNPLGALMVYGLWAMVALVGVTGVVLENLPASGLQESLTLGLHEGAANAVLAMAFLHVGGVLFESWRVQNNLVAEMTSPWIWRRLRCALKSNFSGRNG